MKVNQQYINQLNAASDDLKMQWLHRYAVNQLNEEEKNAFEWYVNQGDDVALKVAMEGLQWGESNEESLIMLKKKVQSKTLEKQSSTSLLLRIAAVGLLLVSVGLGVFYYQKTIDSQEFLVDSPEIDKKKEINSVVENIYMPPIEHHNENKISETPKINDQLFPLEGNAEAASTTKDEDFLYESDERTDEVKKVNAAATRKIDLDKDITPDANTLSEKNIVLNQNGASEMSAVELKEQHNGINLTREKATAASPALTISGSTIFFKSAEFRGGTEEMNRFIKKEQKKCLDDEDVKNAAGKTVQLRVMIKKDGKVQFLKITKSLNPACDQEAIRIVKKMPKWIPANASGKQVEEEQELQITFE